MLDLKTTAAALLALSMSAGVALAQNAPSGDEGGRTFPRPETFGPTEPNRGVEQPALDTAPTGSIRNDDFNARWQAMTPGERDRVRANCNAMNQNKALYSDNVDSLCKSVTPR
ncbi:hypothetical protein GCM10011491_11900 [Brucella endophytica]|uniref:Uncharacterized protein n=2 Tax=Brucella endophytica TaxID=1963359 RepID=A0A916S6X4_9HYPH|nr:hypothetical protein GCM10011491_11900 [Brucella endophytica]